MARNAIENEFRASKMADRSEMAKNAIKTDFRTSEIPAENKVPYRSEMARNAIESEFRTSQMADRSEMARNVIKSDFLTFRMAAGGHLKKNIYKKSCPSDLNNVRTDCCRLQLYINSPLVNI